eukprot:Nk52_evm21s215 gene=Nk52_evmTU21s215
MEPSAENLPCDDIIEFKEVLKTLRKVDDNVIYELNSAVPTKSFKTKKDAHEECKDLFEMLHQAHSSRNNGIKKCIKTSEKTINELRNKADEDPSYTTALRSEQSSLRMMNAELFVEEVVRDRTIKAFSERCKAYKIPRGYEKEFN